MTLHIYTPNQYPYQLSTSYTLRFLRYSPDKIFKLKVTTARSNQGHIIMLHTYTPEPMSLPSFNFLHLTFQRYSPDEILKVKVTTERSNQGHAMMLHTYTSSNQCPYQVSNSYTLLFLRYCLEKLFPAAHKPTHPSGRHG